MDLTQRFLAFTLLGAEWVLWLLVGLSVFSVAIMIERGWYFFSHSVDLAAFQSELAKYLRDNDVKKAKNLIDGKDSVEHLIVSAALNEIERGPDAVQEAMVGCKARERHRLERGLTVLGTLGNNAPFIGLFGTVLGIIKAFHDLAKNQAGGVGVVMAGISEALVATAVGLLVAIPAVVGFNFFNRRVRATLANSDSLVHTVLAVVKGETGGKAKLAEVK
jgi:biopolymer transport protein ExbB